MPITSFTGLPGNGKTALMMEHLISAAREAARPLFAAGIDGLQPGFATVLSDPREWNAVRSGERCSCHDTEDSGPCDAHVVPNGSLIYVDEAWKWFGHLHDATRQQTPKHVLALAEHRHRGIDFVWTFQQPNQIYPFARGLMAEHHHVVRRFGTRMIDVFTWAELNEDVKSQAKREAAQRKTRTLPSDVFDAYKSAEIHTIKARIPLKVLAIPLMVVVAVFLGWYAVNALRPDAFAADLTGKTEASPTAVTGPVAVGEGSRERKQPLYANATEYATAHLPRFGMMPWTAPVFDERGITADPALYCLSSLGGENAQGEPVEPSCTCLTEQGTLYDVSQPECRTIARRGPIYNPYKERKERRDESPQWGAVGEVPATVSAGAVIPGDIKAVGTSGEAGAPGTAP